MSDKVQIIFSFDTTGSMYPCLSQVRTRIQETFLPLLKEFEQLSIEIVAHGDYGDKAYSGYDTLWSGFTNDLVKLNTFVTDARKTVGFGNGGECYELVLHQARMRAWDADAKKIIVMIGDEPPHTANYHENRLRLDWRTEASMLGAQGIRVYTVQALSRSVSNTFYRETAEITGGVHLVLDQFTDIVDLIKAVVYNEEGAERLEAFEAEVVAGKRMNRALDRSFGQIKQPRDAKGRWVSTRFADVADGLTPVSPGRFQILNVSENQDIKGFVLANSLEFKIGRGFYEFTKREEIQEKKEVVLRDKVTGDMYSGAEARNLIGLPFGERGMIKPSELKYDVFVQSTSVNRKLMANTRFLYEVDMDH